MKKIFILIIIFFSIKTLVFGQPANLDNLRKDSEISIPTKLTVDTLKVQSVSAKELPKEWYLDNNMPWAIALIISTFGILANVYVTFRITNRQIRATLSTSNRQTWVNETRNVITELMTQAKLLSIEYQEKEPNVERRKIIFEKVIKNRTKLLLLLKTDKNHHKFLLDLLTEFINMLDKHMLNDKVKNEQGISIDFDNHKFIIQSDKIIECGRTLLYDEWGKIQSIK
jgi:hypothetical protein